MAKKLRGSLSVSGLEAIQPLTRARGLLAIGGSRGDQRSSPLAAAEPSVHTRTSPADFLAADASAKCTLVEKLARPWSLAPTNSAEPSKVGDEQVTIIEVRLSLHYLRCLYLPFLS